MAMGDVVQIGVVSGSGSATAFNPTFGSATTSGNLLIAFGSVTQLPRVATIAETGWAKVYESSTGALSSTIWWKQSDGTELGVNITLSGTGSGYYNVIEIDATGVDLSALDASAQDETNINTPVNAQSTGTAVGVDTSGIAVAFFGIDISGMSTGRAYTNSFIEQYITPNSTSRSGSAVATKVITGNSNQCTFSHTDTIQEMYGSILVFGAGAAPRSITDIDTDNDVQAGQTAVTITGSSLDTGPVTQTATLGGQALTITNWNSGSPIVDIPLHINLEWGQTYQLDVTDDTGTVSLTGVTLSPATGWEQVTYDGSTPPVGDVGFVSQALADLGITMAAGDSWVFESATGMTVALDGSVVVDPPATVTGSYKVWDVSAGGYSVIHNYMWRETGILRRFFRNANRNNVMMGEFPLGDAPVLSGAIDWPAVPPGALWVATTGNDTTGDGTVGNPYLTITHGTSQLISGGTLVIKDGIYDGVTNIINDYSYTIPSGTPGNYTTIRSENIFGVTLTITSGTANQWGQVRTDGSYIDVFGFIVERNTTGDFPSSQVELNGNHNKFRKSIVRRLGVMDAFGSWVRIGQDSTYNLCEDVAGVGVTRYGFGAGSNTVSTGKYNIFRRCVGRFDMTGSHQPKATFNHYGNAGGFANSHHIYQNCISLDGNEVGYHGGTDGYKFGGFSSIKSSSDDMYVGNIVLNEFAEYGGFWLDGRNHILRDNVVWNIKTMPTYGLVPPDGVWDRPTMSPIFEASNFTVGQTAGTDIGGDSTNLNVTNSNLSPVGQQYLLQPNSGNTTGATILKRVGVTGTLYGESGWDTVTNEDLWPWQYEDKIKEIFSLPNPVPTGYTPVVNDTLRGFCAPGNDAYGQPLTLTRYIWQYLGTQIPASVYGGP